MKKIAAALALALGASFVPSSTASAHITDNWANYYCAKHRTPGTVITHATQVGTTINGVIYYCRQGFFGVEDEYEVQAALPLSGNFSFGPLRKLRCQPNGPAGCTDHRLGG